MVAIATTTTTISVYRRSEMCTTVEEAKRHFGRKCGIMECWHWCPKCGAYWCHYTDVKAALDKFTRVCYSDSARCLNHHVPRTYAERRTAIPVLSIRGHVRRADTEERR